MSLSAPVISYNYVSKETDEPSSLYEIVLNVDISSVDISFSNTSYILEYGIFSEDPNTHAIDLSQWRGRGIEAFSTSQQGIVNQVNLQIATDVSYGAPFNADGTAINSVVMVRTILSDGRTSAWSNALNLKPPYIAPVIHSTAWFNSLGHGELIQVVIDPSSIVNPVGSDFATYDISNVKCIVTVYADPTNSGTSTQWSTSQPLSLRDFGSQEYYLVDYNTDFSMSGTDGPMYVAVNLVYSTTDNDTNYKVISYTSETMVSYYAQHNAPQLQLFRASDSTDPSASVYNVYADNTIPYPGDQTMTLQWVEPAYLAYSVNGYRVEGSTSGSFSTITHTRHVANTVFNTTFDVSGDLALGTTLFWRVVAVYDDTSEVISNVVSENMFAYANTPYALNVDSAEYDGSSLTVNFSWENPNIIPASDGPGVGYSPQYHVVVYDSNGTVITDTQYFDYSATALSYSSTFTTSDANLPFNLVVGLGAQDTNDIYNTLYGVSAERIVSPTILTDVSYQVYLDNTNTGNNGQSMILTWTPPDVSGSGVTITGYDTYYSLNGAEFLISDTGIPSNASSYDQNVSIWNVQGNTLSWKIMTHFSDGTSTLSNAFGYSATQPFEMFVWPTQPATVNIPFADIHLGNTLFDCFVQWTAQSTDGYGTAVDYIVSIEDASRNVVYGSKYVSSSTFECSFNDLSYNSSVTYWAFVSLEVTDVNPSYSTLTGNAASNYFRPIDVPVITAVSSTVVADQMSAVSFHISTGALLGATSLFAYANDSSGATVLNWKAVLRASVTTSGINVTTTSLSVSSPVPDTYEYDISLSFSPALDLSAAHSFTVSTSNFAGEGFKITSYTPTPPV